MICIGVGVSLTMHGSSGKGHTKSEQVPTSSTLVATGLDASVATTYLRTEPGSTVRVSDMYRVIEDGSGKRHMHLRGPG
jgi:hypothetical protein